MKSAALKVLLATAGAWHLPHTAQAMERRDALAGLWISLQNSTKLSKDKYQRCWPFHLAMKPFYHLLPQIWEEKAFYAFFPLWNNWLKRQSLPPHNVVQTIIGFGSELFDQAEKTGALKVADCPNSHPLKKLLRIPATRI